MLLSRSPLASTRRWVPFDLHVLGAPPAFILSQDRTLRPNKVYWARRARPASDVIADRIHSILVVIASSCWKGMTRLSPYHTLYSVHHCYHRNGIRSVSRRMHPRCSASQYPVLKVRAGGSSRCRAAGINNARAGGRRPRESAPPHSAHIRGRTLIHAIGYLKQESFGPLPTKAGISDRLSPGRTIDWLTAVLDIGLNHKALDHGVDPCRPTA